MNGQGHRFAFMKRHQIGRDGDVYLDRLRIVETPWFGVFLHTIHRPDADDGLHDHPWSFVRIILRGGYREQYGYLNMAGELCMAGIRDVKRVSFMNSTDLHRIALLRRTPTTTLVLVGPRRKTWGFVDRRNGGRWVQWRQYLAERTQ